MALNVSILSLSQDMDLESGTMSNFMLVRLSTGQVLRALIDDNAAQAIVCLAVEGNGQRSDGGFEDMGTQVFGGANGVTNVIAEDGPPPVTAPPRAHRAPIVSKDDLGYPVVHRQISPVELSSTPSDGRDEDGVSAL